MNQPSAPGNRRPGRFIHVEASGLGSSGNAPGNINSLVNKIRILPNPTSSKFKFEFQTEQSGQTTVLVFSADGRVLKRESIVFTQGSNSFERDYSHLNPGLYILVTNIGDQRYSGKLIISR